MKHKGMIIIVVVIAVVALICLLSVTCSKRLQITHYKIESAKIKNRAIFAVVTDLHTSEYGANMQTLIQAINDVHPDAVFFCGDIFDNHFESDNAWTLLKEIAASYTCCYVSGNNEINDELWDAKKEQLEAIDIQVLCGDCRVITVGDNIINVLGVDDCTSDTHEKQLESVSKLVDTDKYNILLSHRPHLIDEYADTKVDLVISGHAHGGQWRIPIIAPDGVYVPDQGVFPKYTAGVHSFDTWNLVISRGLDKQAVNYPRICNRPELVFVTLQESC